MIRTAFQSKKFTFSIPFTDTASVENAIHCCAMMLFLGFSFEIIQKRMLQLVPISMRLELKEGINNCTIINDSYNSDLTSLELALNYAIQRNTSKKLVLILSDILQSGLKPAVLYHKVAQLIIAKKINSLIAIGKDIEVIQQFLPSNFGVSFFKNTNIFLTQFTSKIFNKNIVLLKGARIFEFERIVNRFEEKVHKVVLEVDLSAIVHNLKIYGNI